MSGNRGSDLRVETLQKQYEDLCGVMKRRESAWQEQKRQLEHKVKDYERRNERQSEQLKAWETQQSEWKNLERDWKMKESEWMKNEDEWKEKEDEWKEKEDEWREKEDEWNTQRADFCMQQDQHNVNEAKWREDRESLQKCKEEIVSLKKKIIMDSSQRMVEDFRRNKEKRKSHASPAIPTAKSPCPKAPHSANRKSISSLGYTRQRERCNKIADLVLGEIGECSEEELRETLDRVMELVAKIAGITLTANQASARMTTEETALIRLRYFTGKSFERFKSSLLQLNCKYNIFAATGRVKQHIRSVTNRYTFKSTAFTYLVKKQKRGRPTVETEILKELLKKRKIEKSRRRKVEDAELSGDSSDDEDERTVDGVLCEMSGFSEEFSKCLNEKAAAGNLLIGGQYANPTTREPEIWMTVEVDTGDRITKFGAGTANTDYANSVLNFQIGAIWNGDDSRKNLASKGRHLVNELNGMTHLSIRTPNGDQVFPIRQFVGCDFKAAHALMGMDGAMGSHDCFYGYRRRGITFKEMLVCDPDLRFNPYSDPCEPRTLQSFYVHCQTVNGERYNVSHPPLLERVPPDQVTPDPLHLIMGISSNSDEELRCAFIRKDLESNGIIWPGGEKECNKLIKDNRAKIMDLAQQYDRLKGTMANRTLQEHEKPNFYATMNGLEREKARLAIQCKEIQKSLRLNGTHGKILKDRLIAHGLLGNFYNAKTGNQVSKMLSHEIIDQLWSGYITEENNIFVDIMHDLADLLYYAKARFLEIEEIEEARELIASIMLKMGQSPHKNRKLTLKWHVLSRHVVDYMQRWKTWGLMSSQQIEAVHPKCTRLFIQYSSVKDKKRRFELVANAFHAEVVLHGKQKREGKKEKEERLAIKRRNKNEESGSPTSRRQRTVAM